MKEYLNDYLVKVNFESDEFSFCNIIVKKIDKDSLQVISYTGKLGNKGRATILYEIKTDNFTRFTEELKRSINLAKDKINEKKFDGFFLKEDLEIKIKEIYHKKNNEKRCSLCENIIKEETYETINKWARGDGKWDLNKDFIGYNKVICIPCQIEHSIFKKSKK